MTVNEIVTLISLGLTPLTIIFSFLVILIWFGSARNSYSKPAKKDIDWFIMGVVIGFVGSAVDNFYWGITWSSGFVTNDYCSEMFKNGVYSNVVFRQVCTGLAAACHIKAACGTDDKTIKFQMFVCAILGVMQVIILLYLRSVWR